MQNDKKQVQPRIILLVNKENKVVAYTAVNVPQVEFVYEDEDNALYKRMLLEGTSAIADPTVNFCTGLNIGHE